MDKKDLLKFCVLNDCRKKIREPFSDEKYTYVTNGHVAIRIEKDKNITAKGIDISSLIWIPEHEGNWVLMPEYETPDKIICQNCMGTGWTKKCDECHGVGEITFDNGFHIYECECKSCDGNGSIPRDKKDDYCDNCDATGQAYEDQYLDIRIYNTTLSIELLDKIKNLPGIRLYFPGKKGYVNFKFDGGVGILMKMREDKDDENGC